MTPTQRKSLTGWGVLLLPFVIALLVWAFKTFDASLVHQAEYRLDRQRDSTALQHLDRRSLVTLCRLAPQDSECAK